MGTPIYYNVSSFQSKDQLKRKKEISTFSTHNSVSFVNRLIGYMVQFTK